MTLSIFALNRSAKLALAVCAVAAVTQRVSADIVYPDFSNVSGLQINGSSHQAGNVLRLTDNYGQGGSTFSQSAVTLADDVSFSSFFSFRITTQPGTFGDGDGPGADGLAFVVQTVSNSVGGGGGGLGYAGLNRSMAIEFDTYNNGSDDHFDGNHVGIDYNGSLNSAVFGAYPTRFNDGQTWNSWVDYNGATNDLEVRFSLSTVRPTSAFLSTNVDLVGILGGTNAFVGFTSGTGSGYGVHDILSWEFRDTYNPVTAPPSVADGADTFLLIGPAALGLLAISRRRSRRASQA